MITPAKVGNRQDEQANPVQNIMKKELPINRKSTTRQIQSNIQHRKENECYDRNNLQY